MSHGVQEKIWFGVVTVVSAFLLHLGWGWYGAVRAEAQCKQNLLTIQAALERYSYENRYYPTHLQQLIDAGFLTSMPANPYANGAAARNRTALMRELHEDATEPGGVAYVPSDGYQSSAYVLAVYGDERSRKAGRTMAGRSLQLEPQLAARATRIAWDRALLMVQGKGVR
jgi:hypothetical protein